MNTEQETYTFHTDPGHGWMEVKKAEIDRLGISDKVSQFSYQNGDSAYLEEDCDAGAFLEAKRAAGEEVTREQIRETHTDEDHPIRNYKRYGTVGV